MKQTSTKSGGTFNKYLVLILTVLNFPFSQFILGGLKNKVYPAFLNNALKSILVCMALGLMPAVTKADTPIPTTVVSSYDAALQRLTMTVKWTWGTNASNKHVGAAVFADLNGDGITPTIFDNPATYTSGGNPFPAGLQARDEFLGQLAVSTIEGSASSSLFAGSDNTDNGIASGVSGMTTTSARLLLPYLGNSMAVVNTVTGTFTLIYNNVPVSPSKICVVLYDPHTPFYATGGHSVTSAGSGRNTDNSIEEGNSQGTVPCNSLVVLRCAVNKTEVACQTQTAVNESYAAWIASVTAFGCNGVLTNNSTGAPSATGGSKTVTFTYTQSGCSNQAAVTTCTATFTVPTCIPCNGRVTSLYFNELNGGADLPITNGSTFTVAQLGSLYNLETATSGTIGSIKFTITGPTPTTVIENAAPYNSPGTNNGAWTGAVGTYTVNLKTYSASGATGTLCHDTTITFILTTTLTLGNRVWYDADNDGINDAAENGIRNIAVKLYADANNDNVPDGASIASATTDANGYYSFSGLNAGNYIVGVIIPNGYMSSSVNGGDPDNNTDLDDNGQVAAGNEIRGLAITLIVGGEPTSGNTNNTYDFGLLPDCACTNSAGNLLINANFENGTTGWSWSGGTLTTGTGYIACGAANGFNNWSSGTSKVWQDVTVVAGSIVSFSAFAGTHAPGIACSPKLSLVFLNAANAVISQSDVTVTRVVGDYNDQLEQYAITAVAPAGTVKVRVQSTITCNTMKLDAFCLTVVATGSVSDFVWTDLDRDGIQDPGEPGIAGVTVTLYNSANQPIGSAITNNSGNYLISNVLVGTGYYVKFTTVPNGMLFTIQNVGGTGANNNSKADATGTTTPFNLAAGQNMTNIDAGLYSLINISGHVWQDANGLTDFQINRNGTDPFPNTFFVYLVDNATNLVVQLEAPDLANNGSYSFLNVDINHSYRIILSTVLVFPGDPAPISFMPQRWLRVGENLGAGPFSGDDGIPNGVLFIDTETSDLFEANFGVKINSGEIIIG